MELKPSVTLDVQSNSPVVLQVSNGQFAREPKS